MPSVRLLVPVLPPGLVANFRIGAVGAGKVPIQAFPRAPMFAEMPPLSLTLILALTCCLMGLIVGVLVVGFVAAMRSKHAMDEEDSGTTKAE